ncbi:MAG: DNA-binding protein [Ignavibacteria bacterium]|nr:DNA-binding protein [Ignavibacteria bacterium]
MPDLEIIKENLIERIYFIRGEKVMMDFDLALLYETETRTLKQAVRRNIKRFPEDFMITLTRQEFNNLRSQFVTSRWGGARYLPYAFTELGVAMLSSVLKSEKAIEVNIAIMRTFVQLRKLMSIHKELAEKIIQIKGGSNNSYFFVILNLFQNLSS